MSKDELCEDTIYKFKPIKLRLKIDLVSYPTRAERLVNTIKVVTFNFNNIWKLYRKSKTQPVYINIKSDHPPKITKHIYSSISHRLTMNSSNIEIFNKVKMEYEIDQRNNRIYTKLNYTLGNKSDNNT